MEQEENKHKMSSTGKVKDGIKKHKNQLKNCDIECLCSKKQVLLYELIMGNTRQYQNILFLSEHVDK